jgi:hypothetical protein
MANPSLQIGNSNWAIKEDDLLGYSTVGTNYLPKPMTMTRASAGTRVNPQGLVETVELLGGSALTGNNSNFDTGIGSWITYIGGSLAHDTDKLEVTLLATGSGARIDTNSLISGGQAGKTFKVRAKIWQGTTTATSLNIYLGSSQETVTISSTPTYFEVLLTPSNTGYLTIYRGSSSGGTFFIDDVTVKEVTRDNLARVDYTDGTSSLLVEPQRTNLIKYSESFDSWYAKNYVTVAENTSETISPSGNNTASKITINSVSTVRRLYELISASSGSDYTFTLYAKKGTTDFIKLFFTTSIIDAEFNLTNGTVTSGTGSIESVGNDWYRLQATGTSSLTGEVPQIQLSSSASVSDYLYVWGCQVEQGSYATSYIPNFGTALGVTRVQDQYEKTGISNLINSEEGVLFAEMAALADDSVSRKISLNSGTFANQITVSYGSGVSNRIQCIIYDGINVVVNMSYSSTNITNFNKIAIKYISGNTSLWVNGVEVDTDNAAFSGLSLSTLSFDNGSSTNFFYGKVKQLQVFKTALTDTELATLTQ